MHGPDIECDAFEFRFYIGLEVPADSQLSKDFPLYGPNIWPNETAGILPGFRDDMNVYGKHIYIFVLVSF